MNIQTLLAYVPAKIVATWRARIGDTLTDVQARAVRERLFEGQSLLVLSPTSSGKTFVGEMAAVRVAMGNKRVIYLVPLKALAEEKAREFSRYAEHGLRVVVSHRDRREHDAAIEDGRYDIAILVFEKLERLLVSKPGLLAGVGLIVLDELQTLVDKQRGAALEILLTRLRISEHRTQFLGLSAVLADAEVLARWLGAKLLVSESRPVELRKGPVVGGRFLYREHNTGKVAVEQLTDFKVASDDQHLVATVQTLCRMGQALVFVPDRERSRKMAELLARHLPLDPAQAVCDELATLEEGFATSALSQTCARGVAFHNSDLTFDQRDIIERGFRSGVIRVLVSTSTLAVGVNFPVENVLIPEPWKWQFNQTCRKWTKVDLPTSEFENMAGRAGRLGFSGSFGRALVLVPSRWHQNAIMRTLIDGPHEPVRPTLRNRRLEDTVLELVASNAWTNETQLGEFLLETFTGFVDWARDGAPKFRDRLVAAVERLIKQHLLYRTDGEDTQLAATRVGRIAAERGLSARTAEVMARWALAAADRAYHPLEVLFAVSLTPDAHEVFISRGQRSYSGYVGRFREAIARVEPNARLQEWFEEMRPKLSDGQIGGLKKAVVLAEWLDEKKIDALERDHQTWAGAIASVGSDYARFIEALAEIADAVGWTPERVRELGELGQRLRHGVRADLVTLADLRIRGLGRGRLRKLAEAGLSDADKLRAADVDQIATVVRHRGLALQVHAALTRGAYPAAISAPAEVARDADGPGQDDRCVPKTEDPTTCPIDAPVAFIPEGAAPAPIVEAPARFAPLAFSTRYDRLARHCFVTLAGHEDRLTPVAFAILLRVMAAKKRGLGRQHKHALGACAEYGWKGFIRLRKQLEERFGKGASGILDQDGHGHYGTTLDASEIELDLAALSKHPNQTVRTAVEALQKLALA